MLGVAPDNRGLLPDSDAARLKEFGEAIRTRYSHNLALGNAAMTDDDLALGHVGTTAEERAALDGDPDTFWSAPAGSHHATLEASFPKPVTFNRALTMEWLNDGQHVEKYSIEIWDGPTSKWKKIAGAEAIGHKKIDSFAPVTASRVRLNIESSSSEAHIREFQLYMVQ
jgi:alpha-L-fucosidase